MRKTALFLAFGCLLATIRVSGQQALSFQPEKPKAGEKITITYNPSGTPLLGIENISATAYLMEGVLPLAREIKLTKTGKSYQGSFQTNDTTKAVFVSFSGDDKTDNNNDEGYYVMIYSGDGNPAPGARFATGQGFVSYGGIWSLKRNTAKGYGPMKEDFAANPSLKEKYTAEYFSMLNANDKEQLKSELENLLKNPTISEANLSLAKSYYTRVVPDNDKATQVTALLKEKYPSGKWVRADKLNAVNLEKDPAKKADLYNQLVTAFPIQSKDDQALYNNQLIGIAQAYAKAKDYDKMQEYLGKVTNKRLVANALNSVAWDLAGGGLDSIPKDVKMGTTLIKQAADNMQAFMKSPTDKPSYFTDQQYAKQLDQSYLSTIGDSYALLLYEQQDYAGAYDWEKKVTEAFHGNGTNYNECFTLYTEKAKGAKEAQKEIEDFISQDKYTPKMKEQLKRIYLAGGNTENGWATYIAGLEKTARDNMMKELAKKMINDKAPAFALKDMDGSDVSLAALRGKIVVVDFWATWCGPCKASFPGMKLAIEKYKNDPDVKFVFIDTWENVPDKEKIKSDVAAFIQKNLYPFHVLMDYDNKVIEQYKVDGIPTKFIIDKDSNVRFRSVGWNGNTDKLVDEITAMIEMTRSGGTDKKGF